MKAARAAIFCLAAVLLAAGVPAARAQQDETFTVADIRIVGLERVEPTNVLANISFSKGSAVDPEVVAATITRLYGTGLFRDVEISRDGDDVVITVAENPVIAAISIVGMENLDEDDIRDLLESQDIAVGRILRRGVEDDIERIILASYGETAHYLTSVQARTVPQEGNSANVLVTVSEGAEVRIASIRIFGAEAFDEDDLLDDFELETSGLLATFFDDDVFSKSALDGDLERLRSRYLSEGFIRFEIAATDARLDLEDFSIAIAIHISEGARYTFADPLIVGADDLSSEEQEALRPYEPGQIYADTLAAAYARSLRAALRNIGYAFAEVEDSFEIDDAAQQVRMTYQARPGKLVEVRRITFVGNNETSDEVLRRQFILFEGELFSGDKLERSLRRLRRTGYLLSVEAREIPVSDDEVDIEVNVAEEGVGRLAFGVGYSKSDGVSYSASYSRRNILGSGNDFAISGKHTDDANEFALSFKQDYFTDTGISRDLNFYLRNETEGSDASTSFDLDRLGVRVRYTIPIDDSWSWRPGFELERFNIDNPAALASVTLNMADDYIREYGENPYLLKLLLGVAYDTRNRAIEPTEGTYQRLGTRISVPPGDLRYYQLEYNGNWYAELGNRFALDYGAKLRYGDGYGDGVYPFYELYSFASRDLRGFKTTSIEADGGRLLGHMSAEIERPIDIFDGAAKIGFYLSAGGLWSDPSDFDGDDIRAAAGVQLSVRTPVAPMLFSYGVPILKKDDDVEERFQFILGL